MDAMIVCHSGCHGGVPWCYGSMAHDTWIVSCWLVCLCVGEEACYRRDLAEAVWGMGTDGMVIVRAW